MMIHCSKVRRQFELLVFQKKKSGNAVAALMLEYFQNIKPNNF